MQLGLFTPVFNHLSFDEMIAALKPLKQIQMLELGTGGWPGDKHLDVEGLLASRERATEFLLRLADAGYGISALSCHGNPVHPEAAIAQRDDLLLRRTMTLAERLHVPVVVTFSGCPGGAAADSTPNWITAPWPPEYADALRWQWEERLIPYWTKTSQIAEDTGVRVALEAHPGFCVYNTETLLRLRSAVGTTVGMNLDPSHLWWQGMDIPAVIKALGEAIFHVHAKDVTLDPRNVALNGVLDPKSFRQMTERSWLFRTVGWGHSELEWKGIVSALRLAGYDYVLSIEHEDALASVEEGLAAAVEMLSRVLLTQPPVEAWWA